MLKQLICMSRTCNYAGGSVTHRIAEFVLKRQCARRPPKSTRYSDFYIVNILLLLYNLKSHYVEHFSVNPETPPVTTPFQGGNTGKDTSTYGNPSIKLPASVLNCVCLLCVCVFITAGPMIKLFAGGRGGTREEPGTLTQGAPVFPGYYCRTYYKAVRGKCVCLLLQDLLQSCSRGGEEESRGRVL